MSTNTLVLPGSSSLPYATFNGWQIIPMPTHPAPREVDFSMSDTVGQVTSPFSLTSQQQYWAGGDYWKLNVSLPPMSQTYAMKWRAWMGALRGVTNVFQIGDPLHIYPSTLAIVNGVTPVTNGQNNATSIVLATRGWPVNATVLNPGDYLQIGYRLYMVAGSSSVISDGTGTCTIEVWPSLRESPADGTQINLTNPTGLFRLQTNERDYTSNFDHLDRLSFKAVEAR